MKIANSDSNNNAKPNKDSIVIHTCGICGKKHFLNLLFIQNRVRFRINDISPVFDEICIDCTHCGMTTYHTGEHAYNLMRYYFNVINPEYAKSLTIPNTIRVSKDYFEFIKVIS